MENKPIKCGVAFRVTDDMNANMFSIHLNAAVRAIKRHFGVKAFQGHDEYRQMEFPSKYIKMKADDGKIKLSCMHVCEAGSGKCFIVDEDGNEHECSPGEIIEDYSSGLEVID